VRGWLSAGVEALGSSDIVGGYVSVLTDGTPLNPVEAFEKVFAFDNESYVKKKGFSGSGNLFVSSRSLRAGGWLQHRSL
jgi:hypothetical protein